MFTNLPVAVLLTSTFASIATASFAHVDVARDLEALRERELIPDILEKRAFGKAAKGAGAAALAKGKGGAAAATGAASTASTAAKASTGKGKGTGTGSAAAASASVAAAVSSASTAGTGKAATGSGIDSSSLTLDADAVQTGSASDGQNALGSDAGQAASATDNANFINFCSGKTLTNGLQQKQGSCNGIVMGNMPASDKMVSSIITTPTPGQDIDADTTFNVSVAMANIVAGSFTNPDVTYYAAPQDLSGGVIVGHTHVTIQNMGNSLTPTQPLDASQFAFFKGINNGPVDGLLTATVTGGLAAGNYRACTLSAASNHQPVLMPVAQRGSQDDCTKFTVGGGAGGGGKAATGGAAAAAAGTAAASTTSTAATAKTGKGKAAGASSAAAAAGTTATGATGKATTGKAATGKAATAKAVTGKTTAGTAGKPRFMAREFLA